VHIDPLSPRFVAPERTAKAPAAAGGPDFRKLMADRVELSDGIPAEPPPEVLEQVDVAAEVMRQLQASGRELRFQQDERSGKLVIEVRDASGQVLRRIPPNEALAIATREQQA
jgi:hypothetical protein